jgi:hypothetical protein
MSEPEVPRPPMRNRPETETGFAVRLAGAGGGEATATIRIADGTVQIIPGSDGRRVDVHLDNVEEVRRDGTRLEIAIRGRPPLALECGEAELLDRALVAACCTIPEVTRAVRSLGSSRRHAGGGGQREFFAPFLDARRRAEDSVGRAAIIRAFDSDRLNRALDAYLKQLSDQMADARPAARRAFAAQAEEATAPLRAAILAVADCAKTALAPDPGNRVGSWRRWSGALGALFLAADRAWKVLRPVRRAEPADEG